MPSNIGNAMRNLFGGSPGRANTAAPQNPNVPQGTGTGSTNKSNTATGTGQVPSNSSTILENAASEIETTAGGKKKTENPLDEFSNIWHPPTDKDGKPLVKKGQEKLFNFEPKAFFEHAAKQDFKKFVKPETLAKIAKGGEGTDAALSDLIQELGSNIFATSSLAATKMIEKAMEHQRGQFEASLPELLKKLNLGENLRSKNPVLNHPASQPIVEALKTTLAQNHPDATTAELQETAERFLTTWAAEISGKKETTEIKQGKKGGDDQDWSKFLPDFLQ